MAAGPIPREVVLSLYRSLLRETSRLDRHAVLKTLMPLPKRIQNAVGRVSQLYTPDTIAYTALLRQAFRAPSATVPLSVGFDALNAMRGHRDTVEELLPKIMRDHGPLIEAFGKLEPSVAAYHAKRVSIPAVDAGHKIAHVAAGEDRLAGASNKALANLDIGPSSSMRCSLLRKEGFDVEVGMGLIAHPLSSAHTDRRVMLVTEKTSQSVSGLVLDMMYSYQLSVGNPMFPEALWGHDVYNGGYCHVDFTMPPTANVFVLHTLEPPRDEATAPPRWLSWALQTGVSTAKPREHHDLLCKPLIRGGEGEPTLYYSKVEALPYLATLAPGKLRSSVRVYWGCMRWSSNQLLNEVALGHWIPVQLSPSFFQAYAVNDDPGRADDTFPTEAMLADAREQREKLVGVDATPPQTYPPDQPMCRREALWDQVLYSLGGEYRELVGSMNPFARPPRNEFSRAPPVDVIPDRVQELLADTLDDDDDDDDHRKP